MLNFNVQVHERFGQEEASISASGSGILMMPDCGHTLSARPVVPVLSVKSRSASSEAVRHVFCSVRFLPCDSSSAGQYHASSLSSRYCILFFQKRTPRFPSVRPFPAHAEKTGMPVAPFPASAAASFPFPACRRTRLCAPCPLPGMSGLFPAPGSLYRSRGRKSGSGLLLSIFSLETS